jgi:hypothetical protein
MASARTRLSFKSRILRVMKEEKDNLGQDSGYYP